MTIQRHDISGLRYINRCRFVDRKGFTLVELIVSVAITGILMLGISVFFSSTFQSLFRAQTQTVNTEKQYAINEIMRDKFTSLEKILKISSNSDAILFKNKNTKDQLPFSYIGITEKDNDGDGIVEKYLALKDLMIFNKIYKDGNIELYADSGSGKIRKVSDGSEATLSLSGDGFKNFSSFELIGSTYYIVFPDKNEVKKCLCTNGICKYDDCKELPSMPKLLMPTDIVRDNTSLYISDSGNGRIIKYPINEIIPNDPKKLILATPLKFPTGMAYYDDGSTKWLFVAESFDNKIRKINVDTGITYTVIGDGDDEECKHTAKFCKLNMPTGLFAFDDGIKRELYIADSGNNRILLMKDPGIPENLTFSFKADDNYYLDKIILENTAWTGGEYDKNASNLFADDTNYYNALTKTYSNPTQLTVFSADPCKSGKDLNYFYTYENPETLDIHADDPATPDINEATILFITNDTYAIKMSVKEDCKALTDVNPSYRWKITVDQPIGYDIQDGNFIQLSNPNDIVIQINKIGSLATFTGFQTTKIIIRDYDDGIVGFKESVHRIGDGKLGTDEDMIEVFVDSGKYGDISFPTGVTNTYFANSGAASDKAKIVRIDFAEKTLEPIHTGSFSGFDYVSDFALDLDVDKPLKFTEFNSGKLLELFIKPKDSQAYLLNANIPE